MNGFINLNKDEGMSSAAAVGKIKRLFGCPCGHMGTLDPMATGVLPVGLGKASRLFDYLASKRKIYRAEFTFGIETDTLDTTGEITCRSDKKVTMEEISGALGGFIGEIEQMPPKYSAKSVNGRRGYELARAGVDFRLNPKKVEIYRIECLGQTDENKFKFEIECGGGTYIRSIARDLAAELDTVAVMSELCRTASGVFKLSGAVTLDELLQSGDREKYIIPADGTVEYPVLELDDRMSYRLLNGQPAGAERADGLYRVYGGGVFFGIGRVERGNLKLAAYLKD